MKAQSKNKNKIKVELYEENVLKAAARAIAVYFAPPEIIEILISKNVPRSSISSSKDKSEILLQVFLDIKQGKIKPKFDNKWDKNINRGERYISRIIERFMHPLSHNGDVIRVKELFEKIQNIVMHDDLFCCQWGKSYRIFEKGEYEIAEELRQEDLQEEHRDLLDENDYAALMAESEDREKDGLYAKKSSGFEEDYYVRKKGDTFQYEGKDLKLNIKNVYVKAFDVLYGIVPNGGFCSYKDYEKDFERKYKVIRKLIKKDFTRWAQSNLTEGGKGILRRTKNSNLITSRPKEGFEFNNRKK